jgi:glycerol-3-phosphate dehydrogenase
LVREALNEREVLWAIAPHIIRPLRFVLPHHPGTRPAWLLRLGLFLYDHLGGRKALPPTRTLALDTDPVGKPLKPGMFKLGFEYSDCWVDDARLVALNARDAADRGAVIRTRCEMVEARRMSDRWQITATDQRSGTSDIISARILVNAAGPWVGLVGDRLPMTQAKPATRLVRGSHIVVPKIFEHDRAYLLQNDDNRIVFAIPFDGQYTLIGTTDSDHNAPLNTTHASSDEVVYLCESASAYFKRTIRPSDVVWSYAGVRLLQDDGASAAQSATRDYKLDLETDGGAALLTVLGGKITTYRRLAEQTLALLQPLLPRTLHGAWTATQPLPGGDFAIDGVPKLVEQLARKHPRFDRGYLERLARSYGTRAARILGDAQNPDALGIDFGGGLREAEVRYLVREEWALTAADIVWRRSKLGLRMTAKEIRRLDTWLAETLGAVAATASRL